MKFLFFGVFGGAQLAYKRNSLITYVKCDNLQVESFARALISAKRKYRLIGDRFNGS